MVENSFQIIRLTFFEFSSLNSFYFLAFFTTTFILLTATTLKKILARNDHDEYRF